jgi:hypothetical protein
LTRPRRAEGPTGTPSWPKPSPPVVEGRPWCFRLCGADGECATDCEHQSPTSVGLPAVWRKARVPRPLAFLWPALGRAIPSREGREGACPLRALRRPHLRLRPVPLGAGEDPRRLPGVRPLREREPPLRCFHRCTLRPPEDGRQPPVPPGRAPGKAFRAPSPLYRAAADGRRGTAVAASGVRRIRRATVVGKAPGRQHHGSASLKDSHQGEASQSPSVTPRKMIGGAGVRLPGCANGGVVMRRGTTRATVLPSRRSVSCKGVGFGLGARHRLFAWL